MSVCDEATKMIRSLMVTFVNNIMDDDRIASSE